MTELDKQLKDSEVVEKENKDKKNKFISRIITGFVIFIVGIILIIIKFYNPSFPWKYIILISGGVLLIGLLLFFSFNISNWIKSLTDEKNLEKNKKFPSKEEIENEVMKFIYHRFNHVTDTLEVLNYNVNNNTIICYKLKLLYEENNIGKIVWILININHLYDKPFTFISGDISNSRIKELANSMADIPTVAPDIEETTAYSPMTQTSTTHKVIKHHKEVENKHNEGEIN